MNSLQIYANKIMHNKNSIDSYAAIRTIDSMAPINQS